MSEVINSHILITRGLLKGFSFKESDGEKVWYLDLKDNQIKKEKIKKLGTSQFYYDLNAEKTLSSIENKFGNTIVKIRDFSNKKLNNIEIYYEDFKNIKEFFVYSIFRSEKNIKRINDKSLTAVLQEISPNFIIDFIKYRGSNVFKNFKPNLIINKSNAEFVIPRNVIYEARNSSEKHCFLVLPITKKVAITMLHKDDYSKYVMAGDLWYLSIDDEKSIYKLNEFALVNEKNENNQFIVGGEVELQRLKEYNKKLR